jgi:hypothetical protein
MVTGDNQRTPERAVVFTNLGCTALLLAGALVAQCPQKALAFSLKSNAGRADN